LLIYNRNGTVIFKDETLNDTEFELVWGGRYSNGDLAPEGTYQWVLLRSDGYKESGPLTLVRKR
jgi:flagellar hook assembly protein FlgD